jgi:hypothetical protein
MKRTRLAVLVALLPGLLLVGSASSAIAAKGARPAVVLAGPLGHLPGRAALVVVQVELPYGEAKGGHAPAGYHDLAVAEQQVTTGDFRIVVPDSAILQRAIGLTHGIVEFNVMAFSSQRWTSQMVPVALTTAAANGNRTALAQVQNRVATMPRFRAFSATSQAYWRTVVSRWRNLTAARHQRPDALVPYVCVLKIQGKPVEDMTRIGEVHVGDDTGLKMVWNYYNTSDTSLSVGLSTGGSTGPWSFDGSATTSNSLGSSGGFTAYPQTVVYSDGDMWYQRDGWIGCPFNWTTSVTSAVGDSRMGVNSPGHNPYGSCSPGKDPLGYAVLDPSKGSFDSDRAVAWGYGGDATVWGFTFGGHTGFTSSIHHHYEYNNPGGPDIYVCGGGSGDMPYSKRIFSGSY